MLVFKRPKLKIIILILICMSFVLLYFVLEPIVIELNMNHFRYIHPKVALIYFRTLQK